MSSKDTLYRVKHERMVELKERYALLQSPLHSIAFIYVINRIVRVYLYVSYGSVITGGGGPHQHRSFLLLYSINNEVIS
jgi:hypothetical protein